MDDCNILVYDWTYMYYILDLTLSRLASVYIS